MRVMKTTAFSEQDQEFMSLALHQAEQALNAGDYPVGAVLAINCQTTIRNAGQRQLEMSMAKPHMLGRYRPIGQTNAV